MKNFGKITSGFTVLSVALLAIVSGPSTVQAADGDGFEIYKQRSDDVRLTIAVKGHRAQVKKLAVRETCNNKPGWFRFTSPLMKIKSDGRFGYRFSTDHFDNVETELKARISGTTIRGSILNTSRSVDQKDGSSKECWTGESYRKPKVKFRARLVG